MQSRVRKAAPASKRVSRDLMTKFSLFFPFFFYYQSPRLAIGYRELELGDGSTRAKAQGSLRRNKVKANANAMGENGYCDTCQRSGCKMSKRETRGNRRRGRAEEKVADVGFGIENWNFLVLKFSFSLFLFSGFAIIFFCRELIQLLHGYVVATKVCKGGLGELFPAGGNDDHRTDKLHPGKVDKTCVILEIENQNRIITWASDGDKRREL